MESTQMTPEMEALKGKLRDTWIAGDFGEIARGIEEGGTEFVERLDLKRGDRVLDVACGTGNLAIPAAKLGALRALAPEAIVEVDGGIDAATGPGAAAAGAAWFVAGSAIFSADDAAGAYAAIAAAVEAA